MGIWNKLYRFSAAILKKNRGSYGQASKSRPEAGTPRGLHLEQCEERVLLSVTPSTIEYKDLLWAYNQENALQEASDLTRYSEEKLANVDSWVVGVKDGVDSLKMADLIGADQRGSTGFVEGTYVWEFSTNTSWREAAARLGTLEDLAFYYPLTITEYTTRYVPADPLFEEQWHLENDGEILGFEGGTTDINIVEAWDLATGAGVTIAIVDDGVDFTHEDLRAHYLAALSYDYDEDNTNPSPKTDEDMHGTAVAGAALGNNNEVGGVGSAFDANLVAVRLLGENMTDFTTALALGSHIDQIDISSNSWGPIGPRVGIPEGIGPLAQAAIEAGVTEGRNGKGVIYVVAGGNDLETGGNVNQDGLVNNIHVIGVAAVGPDGKQTYYSTPGAALFISAPSSDATDAVEIGITTTDRTGTAGYNDGNSAENYEDANYTNDFGGTSAAAPIVSGVIALMLEANPALTYRDVQYILQQTAVKNDPDDAGWKRNGAGNWVNHKYGFGLIDAAAAVKAAQEWTNVLPMGSIHSGTVAVNQRIPDSSTQGVSSTISMPNYIQFVERVEVKVNIPHTVTGDLEVVLISPSGTESVLAELHDTQMAAFMGMESFGYNEWTFSSTFCWGEESGGDWQLTVRDLATGGTGTFTDWSLSIHGVEGVSGGPSLSAVIPSTGKVIESGDTVEAAPTELTLRFSLGQAIDPETLSAITVWRTGNMHELSDFEASENIEESLTYEYQVPIGYIGVGDNSNEVIIRFAETLVDDHYEIRIHGNALSAEDVVLQNTVGVPYGAEEFDAPGRDEAFHFELELAPYITTVVPQPTVSDAEGNIIQYRDRVDVYFNNDALETYKAQDGAGNEYDALAPEFFSLIYTRDTATTTDDKYVTPVRVSYVFDEKTRVGKATLFFADDLANLFKETDEETDKVIEDGQGSFRLRIGEVIRGYDVLEVAVQETAGDDSFATAKEVSQQDFYILAKEAEIIDLERIIEFFERVDPDNAEIEVLRETLAEKQAEFVALQAQFENVERQQKGLSEFGNRVLDGNGQTLVIQGQISPNNGRLAGVNQVYDLVWPGGNDEPGHRLHPTNDTALDSEQHITGWDYPDVDENPSDQEPGITLWSYNFPNEYNGFDNVISEAQKDGARQILAMISQRMGIQFREVENFADGTSPACDLVICVGDLAMLGGTSGPGSVAGLGGGGAAVLDAADFGTSEDGFIGTGFTSVMMHEIMHNLGFGHTYDLDAGTIMGDGAGENTSGDVYYESNAEAAFPGNYDVIHGQYLFRLDGMDIDLHKFTLNCSGKFSAEVVAERLYDSSSLNAVLILFDANGNIVARNDDYFSQDSFMEMALEAGTYYIGISSTGNDNYDPTIANSGMYGNTEGDYELRLNFMPDTTKGLTDRYGNLLDGDLDGVAGGISNTWFDVRSTENTVYVDKLGREVQFVTGEDGNLTVTGTARTVKTLDTAMNLASEKTGTVEGEKTTIGAAVRVLGNNYGNDFIDERANPYEYDGNVQVNQNGDLTDNQAYLIGWGNQNDALPDGNTLCVPYGVNVTVDEGVVIKLRQANIEVGSRMTGIDQSLASLQVLGTPYHPVYFTSYNDDSIGSYDALPESIKTDPNNSAPGYGDWGGLVFRNKMDYSHNEDASKIARTILENEGIFLNTVAFADMRYGGGRVNTGGEPISSGALAGTPYSPVYMEEARVNVLFNTLTRNSNAVISADPNSFMESTFHDSSQATEVVEERYTQDYNRVGPNIRWNRLTTTETQLVEEELVTTTYTNSMNGLMIRVDTLPGSSLQTLEVTARFDDYDIVHILNENLTLEGGDTGAIARYHALTNEFLHYEARPDAGLHIDSGIILKMNQALIEAETGAHIIAEGKTSEPIIFTSIYDDRYGAGGVFDTNSNQQLVVAEAGNWGGFYFQPDSAGYFDLARFMYAGGSVAFGGEYFDFNTFEARQAFLRVANSVFENNAATEITGQRIGHGPSNDALFNITNCQPIIVNNVFLNNEGAVISINVNAMSYALNTDTGRATGYYSATEDSYLPIFNKYSDNSGPLVRENRMSGNELNGMVVRAETLTTESTWDDVDIVHIVFDEITIPNFHTYGGLRLQSSTEGSLVVKFQGENAGITATGQPVDIMDRIGGTLQIIGVPGYPVVLTGLSDDTVGAGVDLNGKMLKDTDNSLGSSFPGEWRGLVLSQYSNDTNMETVIESELATGGVELNGVPAKAQYLGALAGNLVSGDENLRLGFEIHGNVQTDRRSDVDVYSFSGTPGQTIWVDVDETNYNLDTIIEIIDFQGNVLATSIYSLNEENILSGIALAESTEALNEHVAEKLRNDPALFQRMCEAAGITLGPGLLTYDDLMVTHVLAMQVTQLWKDEAEKSKEEFRALGLQSSMNDNVWVRDSRDYYAINPKDAGMRVVLPGSLGTSATQNTYYLRVSSYVPDYLLYETDANGETLYDGNGEKIPLSVLKDGVEVPITEEDIINGGQTGGRYQIQVRLQEDQQKPGSMISYGDIRYAMNGITVEGFPVNSPLTTEVGDNGNNETRANAQYIGNVLETNQAKVTVSGYVSGENDVDWYEFRVEVTGIQNIPGVTPDAATLYPVEFDIDYADDLGRPDVDIWVFNEAGQLILGGNSSSLVDDTQYPDTSNPLQNGSYGSDDATIGTVYLPVGTYHVAVALGGMVPAILQQTQLRIEPIESVTRIVEDHISPSPEEANVPTSHETSFGFTAEKYAFSDVTMYISTAGDLFSVNPFTGEVLVDVSTDMAVLPGVYYGDIYMRNDGRIFAMPNVEWGDATPPEFQELNLGNAATTLDDRSTNLIALWPDGEPEDVVQVNNHFVTIHALVSGIGNSVGNIRTNRGFYGVGSTPQIENQDATAPTRNLIWAFNDNGTAVPYPWDGVDADRLPTNPIPLAQLYTSTTFQFTDATDTEFVRGDANTFLTPGDIHDGTRVDFVYSYVDDPDNEEHRLSFEFDTGYDLELNPWGVVGPNAVQDGDTFAIDVDGESYVFEFESNSSIMIPNQVVTADRNMGILEWLQANHFGEGNPPFTFTIVNMENNEFILFELVDSTSDRLEDSTAPEGRVAIDIALAPDNTDSIPMSLASAFATAINSVEGFGITATIYHKDTNYDGEDKEGNEPWGISLSGDTTLSLVQYNGEVGNTLPGIVAIGRDGVTGDNTPIFFDPMHQVGAVGGAYIDANRALGEAIVEAINTKLQGKVIASYANRTGEEINNAGVTSIYNRTVGDRITIASLGAGDNITVTLNGRAAFTNVVSPGENNNIIISGMSPVQADPNNPDLDVMDHHGGFFNGVDVIFQMNTALADVQVNYNETWNAVTEVLSASALTITYNPNVHTANDIINAINNFSFTSRHGTTFQPFIAELQQPDQAGAVNDGSGLLALGAGHTVTLGGGHRGTKGLTYRQDYRHDGTLATDGVILPEAYRILITAEMTGAEISKAFNAAIHATEAEPYNNFYTSILDGENVVLMPGDNWTDVNVIGIEITQRHADSIRHEGEGPGGEITGMAWLHGGEDDDELYAVCNAGGLYRVIGLPDEAVSVRVNDYNYAPVDEEGEYRTIEQVRNTIRLEFIADLGINFSSLSNGPQTVEEGLYSNFLFATDNAGNIYCFDTEGNFQNVFYNGQSSISTGLDVVTGITFSNIDFNLWHETTERETTAGHGFTQTYTGSHEDTAGGTSWRYGLDPNAGMQIFEDAGANNAANNRILVNYRGTNADALNTYETPGGSNGSLLTEEFSLVGYSAEDKPVLTFNYYLDTDDADALDSFRVYITSTDPAWKNHFAPEDVTVAENGLDAQLGTPSWNLIASSDMAIGNIQENNGMFRQIAIDMSAYAGMNNLQLRFIFNTSDSVGVGHFQSEGDWLYALPGYQLSSGDTFSISSAVNAFSVGDIQDFELMLGYRMLLPGSAGASIAEGDWFRMEDRFGNQADFYFVKYNTEIPDGASGNAVPIRITDNMTSVEVADEIRDAIRRAVVVDGIIRGVTADDVTEDDTIVDEQNVCISGAYNLELHMTSQGELPEDLALIESVDGQARVDSTGTIALDSVDRLQFVGFRFIEEEGGAEAWTEVDFLNGEANPYEFSVADRYGSVVNFRLFSIQERIVNPLEPDVVPIIFGNFPRMDAGNDIQGNRVPGDVDGDSDFDTQDAMTIIAMVIQEQIDAGILRGLEVYATGDSVMIKAANWVHSEEGPREDVFVGHTWKSGGYTQLNPSAFPVRFAGIVENETGGMEFTELTYGASKEHVAQAIALAMENCFNSIQVPVEAWQTNDKISFNGVEYVIQEEGQTATAGGDEVIHVTAGATDYEIAVQVRDALLENNSLMFDVLDRGEQGVFLIYTHYTIYPVDTDVQLTTTIGAEETVYTLNRLGTYTASKIKVGEDDKVNIIGSRVNPRILMSSGPLPFTHRLQADTGIDDLPQQGGNNSGEGIYLDDFILGFYERGTMYTATEPNQALPAGVGSWYDFVTVGAPAVTEGSYQLQIRPGTEYGVSQGGVLQIARSLDTNSRLTRELTLLCPQGNAIHHLERIIIGDGDNEIQFQMILADLADTEGLLVPSASDPRVMFTAAGAIPVIYTGSESKLEMAALLVDAVNRANRIYGEGYLFTFDVQATLNGDGGKGGVDLYGGAWITFGDPETTNFRMYQYDGDEQNVSYQGAANGDFGNGGFTAYGDNNAVSSQGLIFINSNMIAYSAENGVNISSAGTRDMEENYPHPGVSATLVQTNADRLVNGVAIINNVIAYSNQAGISFEGDNSADAFFGGARLFAHVANNTIYGGTSEEGEVIGILVGPNSAPTLLNNVVANTDVAISIDATSRATTVVGHNAFHQNVDIGTVGDRAIIIDDEERVFVNPGELNFYPAMESKIIDAARDSLPDRAAFVNLKRMLGIEESPIIAPDLDMYGQRRTDDPNNNYYVGGGVTSFKDIGAIDRVDFEGPTAELVMPLDNRGNSTYVGSDIDPLRGDALVVSEPMSVFSIQLLDNGTGIQDSSVLASSVQVYLWPNSNTYNPEEAILLSNTIDYVFDYDSLNNVIHLYPVTGVWKQGYRYQIIVSNNSEDPASITDLAGNLLQANRPNGNQEQGGMFQGTTQFWIRLSGYDFGDAPDPTYPTLEENDGARHIIVPGFQLGQNVSAELDARENDTDTFDDGVTIYNDYQLKLGEITEITVNVTAGESYQDADGYVGYLNAWLDVNGDGVWDNDGDYVLRDLQVKSGENRIFVDLTNITLPEGFDRNDPDAFYSSQFRFRLTSVTAAEAGIDFSGAADDGEVEDYEVRLVNNYFDYGDMPAIYDGQDPKTSGRHIVTYDADGNFVGPYFGAIRPDVDRQPQWSNDAKGDDDNSGRNDENGIILGMLIPGSDFKVNAEVNLNGATQAYISAWMVMKTEDDGWEWVCIINNHVVREDGIHEITAEYKLPEDTEDFETYIRFRISSERINDPCSLAQDGEIEDYQIFSTSDPKDFGDAPNTYGTNQAANGAWHYIALNYDLYLGKDTGDVRYSGVDAEMNGLPTDTAQGDDLSGYYNDENGVVFVERIVPGRNAMIDVTVTGAGYLTGWIDYNRNGVFDPEEIIIYEGCDNLEVAKPTTNEDIPGYFVDGGAGKVVTFTVPVPENLEAGETYARFRLSSERVLPTGPVGSGRIDENDPEAGSFGEVEDYKVKIELGDAVISGYVFNDLNKNGQWDMQPYTSVPQFTFVQPSFSTTSRLTKGDGIYQRVPLGFNLNYFGTTYSSLTIHTDGYVYFGDTQPVSKEDPNVPMIAVFWSDNDTRTNGMVSYDKGFTDEGNAYIQIIWNDVAASGGSASATNTYVLYIENHPDGSIMAMRYDKIQWTCADGVNGFGTVGEDEESSVGTAAVAGFFGANAAPVVVRSALTEAQSAQFLERNVYTYRFDNSTGMPGGLEPGMTQYDVYDPATQRYYNYDIRICLEYSNGEKVYTHPWMDNPLTVTDEMGYFEFTDLFAGEYIVYMEELQGDLWVATAPNRTTTLLGDGTMRFQISDVESIQHNSTFTITQLKDGVLSPITFQFVDESLGMAASGLGIPIGFNSQMDAPLDVMEKVIVAMKAGNNAFALSAKIVNGVIEIGPTAATQTVSATILYDVNLSGLNGAMEIITSYTNPASADRPAHYVVFLEGNESGENGKDKVSGVDFGAFRKGEIRIVDTTITEGNEGETIVEVDVELTGSFGGEYAFSYGTSDALIASGEILGYRVDEAGNITTEPIYAGQALGGEAGEIVGYYAAGVTLLNKDGSSYVVGEDEEIPIYADYRQQSGIYQFITTPQGTPATPWTITQLTNTLNQNNYDARISGNRIIYVSNDGNDDEIYVYDHSVGAVIWCTDNAVEDNYADIDGDWAIWSTVENGRYQLFAYNLETNRTVRVTDSAERQCINPRISGTTVIWEEVINSSQGRSELKMADLNGDPLANVVTVYYYTPGYEILVDSIRINTNEAGVAQAVWTVRSTVNDSTRVWYYDGTRSGAVNPAATQDESNPQISNGVIVYESGTNTQRDIYYYMIGQEAPVRVPTAGGTNLVPQVSDGIICWRGRDALTGSWDIFYYDTNSENAGVVNISNSVYHDDAPVIMGNYIAWRGETESLVKEGISVWDVYFYDIQTGAIALNITQDDKNDSSPLISEDMIVWRGSDTNSGAYQIYIATKETPKIVETIKLVIYGDYEIEEDEIFKLLIQEVGDGNVIIRQDEATIVILNDDGNMDFGDTPAPYPTLLNDNGARHNANSGYLLGTKIDADTDGRPSVNADGDNTLITNDEDGVIFPDNFLLIPGMTATFKVNVTLPQDVESAKLDAWIDFNGNGNWLDAGDQILTSYTVVNGENTITVAVPKTAFSGKSYARFRLSAEGGLSPTGYCATGEVEDYAVTIGRLPSNDSEVLELLGLEQTTGGDVVTFEISEEGTHFVVNMNGISTRYDISQYRMVTIDALTGKDSFHFVGTEGVENMLIWPTEGYFILQDYNLSVVVRNFTSITADGNGGADAVQLYGSYRDDLYQDEVNSDGIRTVQMTEKTVANREKAYDTEVTGLDMSQAMVTVYASQGGNDLAVMDSIQQGDQLILTGRNLEVVNAKGRSVTYLYDFSEIQTENKQKDVSLEVFGSSSEDRVEVTGYDISLEGSDYHHQLTGGFAQANIYGNGGRQATVRGTGGDDTFTVLPNSVIRETRTADGETVTLSVFGFTNIAVNQADQGTATVALYDSEGDDILVMNPYSAHMYGAGYSILVSGFRNISTYSINGGNDQARIYDSENDDNLYTKQNTVHLFNEKFYNYASGFKTTSVYSTTGGNDSAYLVDTNTDSDLLFSPAYTRMVNNKYAMSVYSFQSVDTSGSLAVPNAAQITDAVVSELVENDLLQPETSRSDNSDKEAADLLVGQGNTVTNEDLSAIDFLLSTGKWRKNK
ncbi:MAG: S8 family serine peptidase [Planctomycetia bacterium]|nr:S8 family serine peptidase [Planctomycetia bacterium]